MPKILDDQLWATLREYEKTKSGRLMLEKLEKKLREELDMKFSDYDDVEVEVGMVSGYGMSMPEEQQMYLVKYTPTERRSISREKLIERGVSLEVLLYATDVTQSRRLTFKSVTNVSKEE